MLLETLQLLLLEKLLFNLFQISQEQLHHLEPIYFKGLQQWYFQ
jgi:hypothetical protein